MVFYKYLQMNFAGDSKRINICIGQVVSLLGTFLQRQWMVHRRNFRGEVWQAVKQIGPLKAPRLGGMHTIFS